MPYRGLLGFLVYRVRMAKTAIFLELKLTGRLFLILRRVVIPVLALRTGQYHNVSHPSATLYINIKNVAALCYVPCRSFIL